MSTTPDELVAARIVAGLLSQQLIAPTQAPGLRLTLATGRLAAQDWQLLAVLNVEDAAWTAQENPWEMDDYGHPH